MLVAVGFECSEAIRAGLSQLLLLFLRTWVLRGSEDSSLASPTPSLTSVAKRGKQKFSAGGDAADIDDDDEEDDDDEAVSTGDEEDEVSVSAAPALAPLSNSMHVLLLLPLDGDRDES